MTHERVQDNVGNENKTGKALRLTAQELAEMKHSHFHPKNYKDVLSESARRDLISSINITTDSPVQIVPIASFLLSRRIPVFFLQGIVLITRKDDLPNSSFFPDDKTVGGYGVMYDESGNAIGSRISIVDGSLSPLLDTLTHEIGHNAAAIIEGERLVRWQKVIEEEIKSPTQYVDKSKKLGKTATPSSPLEEIFIITTGEREDFAETFMLFVMNPGELEEKFPKRYAFMRDLFLSKIAPEDQTEFLAMHEKQLADYREIRKTLAERRNEEALNKLLAEYTKSLSTNAYREADLEIKKLTFKIGED